MEANGRIEASTALLSIGRAEPVRAGVRFAEGQAVRVTSVEDLVLLLLVGVGGAAVGVWATAILHLHTPGMLDGLARTYQATQVVRGFEPKLANLGFVWMPLPSLLQLPLVLAFPGLAIENGVAPIVSGLAAGVGILLLNRILALYVPNRPFRYLILALYQTHPEIVYLTVTGLSEMIFLAFVYLAWLAFQRLHFEEPLPVSQVGVMGIATAGAVLCRYEGVAYGLGLGVALAALMYFQKRPGERSLAEGVTIGYVAPWAYAIAVWIFFNQMIMGDPLYFLEQFS